MAQAITITKSKFIITPIPSEVTKRKLNDSRNKNLIRSNRYNGYLSRRTKIKMERIIEGVIDGLEIFRKKHKRLAYVNQSKPTFVTLTLSYQQFHKDNEIKRKLLSPFIQYAVKCWGVVHYVWRAEPQANGNIHFHILMDKFIDWKDIRSKWNEIQNRLEYIDAFEQKHGHRNPNSSDIHGLKSIDNPASYICKYMGKVDGYRKIEGRIWGCSSVLHKIKNPRLVCDDLIMENVIELKNEGKIFEKVYEYLSVLKIKGLDILNTGICHLSTIYYEFIYENFTLNYLRYET